MKSLINRLQIRASYFHALLFAAFFAFIIFYVYLAQNFSANVLYFYTPDSWYYWSISESIGTDHFNKSNIIRQYQYITDRNLSFPPLWPLAIYLVGRLGNYGHYSSLVASSVFFVLTLVLVEVLFYRSSKLNYVGILVGLLLMAYKPFVLDLMGGMSAGLNIFIIALALNILYSTLQHKHIYLGLVSGLLLLNRFDNVILILAIAAIEVFFTEHGKNENIIRRAALFIFGFAFIVSPYIVFNIENFGVPLISDNSIVFKSINNIYSTYYFIDNPLTILNDPDKWILKFKTNFAGLFDVITQNRWLLYGLAGAMLLLVGQSSHRFYLPRAHLAVLLISSLLVMFIMAGTGYNDQRYFINVYFVAALIVCNYFVNISTIIKFSIIIFIGLQARSSWYSDHLFFYETRNPPTISKEISNEVEKLNGCLKSVGAISVMPIFKAPSEGQLVSYFGAISDFKVYLLPDNISTLTKDEFVSFSRKYKIDAIYERTAAFEFSHDEYPILCNMDKRVRFRADVLLARHLHIT